MKKNVLLQTILLCHLPCYSGSSLHLSLQCRRFFKSIYPCISIVESSPSRVEWRRNSECVLVNQREDGISLVGVCVEQAQCVLWPFADLFFFLLLARTRIFQQANVFEMSVFATHPSKRCKSPCHSNTLNWKAVGSESGFCFELETERASQVDT